MTEPPLVVITDSDLPGDEPERILEAAGLRVRRASCRTAEDVAEAARDATALLVQWAPVTAPVLARLERLRFVSRLGIGYDMIDLAAATARGVAVANTPDYCVEEVAAHTIAMVAALARRLPVLDRAVRDGRWSAAGDGAGALRPSKATVAVIGFGRIGSLAAAHAAALGFRVVVHDPNVAEEAVRAAGHEPAGLAPALAAADIVTLHVPLTERTRHLLNGESIARMRPGVLIVNTCRGGLIDEGALAGALATGHVAGAALDVFELEPLPADSPLRGAPGVLLTPHAAWYSPDSLAELPRRAARQIADFLGGRTVTSIVNPEYAAAREGGDA
ncbi:C-terminal binding protein [Actinomadura bangladeshensis]|uniref:C-terminal binding protein n=1 Tax=Actinomadura bangladeshensis TaxID=453573 RepID=A0A4R4PF35_9ACTN|nr:C-terminal binding protein [Actinomadura bangladeshensis]TDC20418.1 C-terminal binding protein [Actinomadura bangladeshensis]